MAMQMTELHYRAPPSYDASEIVKRAEALLQSGVESPDAAPDSDAGTLLFFHTHLSVQFKDGAFPPQTAILATDKTTDPAAYADAIQQSWSCEDDGRTDG